MGNDKESKVKRFLKNNMFFSVKEESEETPDQSEPRQAQQKKEPFHFNKQGTVPDSDFPMPPPAEVETEVEQQYLDHFMKFLEENNFQGLDYLEFANTLHKMYQKSGNLSESDLYQFAYVSFETQGIKPQTLVQTAQKYIDLVTAHKKEFEKFQATEGSKILQDKADENDKIMKTNTQSEQKIAELQQQLSQLQNSILQSKKKMMENNMIIDDETKKIQAKQTKFENAFKVVVGKIAGDIEKIKSYIK
jgi:hypothetical protein